jgi:hypothetical protein
MHHRNAQLLWGARYAIGKEGAAGDREIFSGESGRKIFVRSDAFPRAWVVHQIDKASTRDKVNEAVTTDAQGFAARALMTSAPPSVEQCAGEETATYQRPAGDMVVVKATLACEGLLVVSDTFFPGWKADIDGRSVELYEVNGAMRGVVVPEGAHTVTMRYRPASVYFGAFLSLAGIVVTLGTVHRSRLRPQPIRRS